MINLLERVCNPRVCNQVRAGCASSVSKLAGAKRALLPILSAWLPTSYKGSLTDSLLQDTGPKRLSTFRHAAAALWYSHLQARDAPRASQTRRCRPRAAARLQPPSASPPASSRPLLRGSLRQAAAPPVSAGIGGAALAQHSCIIIVSTIKNTRMLRSKLHATGRNMQEANLIFDVLRNQESRPVMCKRIEWLGCMLAICVLSTQGRKAHLAATCRLGAY